MGRLGRRCLHPRRRCRRVLQPRPPARAEPQGPGAFRPRPGQHRPSGPGLARHRPGRLVGSRPADRRGNRRGRLHQPGYPSGRPALLRRCEVPHETIRPRPRPPEDPPRRLRRCRRHAGRSQTQTGLARQPGALRQRHRLALHRARPRRLDIRPGRPAARHPRKQRQPERPRTRHRPRPARKPHRPPTRPAPWRLCRPHHARHPRDDRRPDGGMAGHRGLGRLQRHVPVPARRPRRFRRSRGPGTAAPRPVPPRIRRQDAA